MLSNYLTYEVWGLKMKFKIGDKVLVRAPSWCEECVVTKMGFSSDIMFVLRANGYERAIFRRWASIIKLKNQQLLFEFYV